MEKFAIMAIDGVNCKQLPQMAVESFNPEPTATPARVRMGHLWLLVARGNPAEFTVASGSYPSSLPQTWPASDQRYSRRCPARG